MKRAMFGKVATALLLSAASASCSPPTTPEAETARGPASVEGWTRPPMIRSVQRVPGGLVFTGQAEPGARVVLRSDTGPAHAAAANDQGRFEIRITAPTGNLLLRPETQVGQDAAPAPERLLIVAGGQGPVAILRTGGPTRRLDRAPALGAVDSDGRMRLASGRSASGGCLSILRPAARSDVSHRTRRAAGAWCWPHLQDRTRSASAGVPSAGRGTDPAQSALIPGSSAPAQAGGCHGAVRAGVVR